MSAASQSRRPGPHGQILAASRREQFLVDLFDQLWHQYRQRVEYVGVYESVVAAANATFVNDHIAFRTFSWQSPLAGIVSISRIFEALGYRPAGVYNFEEKHLNATHFEHSNANMPKLFISELKTWELEPAAQEILTRTMASERRPVSAETLSALWSLDDVPDRRATRLLAEVLRQFHELPWDLPAREDVLALNKASQYAAWVLVHGYNVNHFTALINSHDAEALGTIDKTVAALREAGVPMKEQVEGAPGSRLRQTATHAVTLDVDVRDRGEIARLPWTYAYFELAQRGTVTDPISGKESRFEGFLGSQATHLFEVTRTRND